MRLSAQADDYLPWMRLLVERYAPRAGLEIGWTWSLNSAASSFARTAIVVSHRHFSWERVSFRMVSLRASYFCNHTLTFIVTRFISSGPRRRPDVGANDGAECDLTRLPKAQK